jgi:hypothetical protein
MADEEVEILMGLMYNLREGRKYSKNCHSERSEEAQESEWLVA